MENKTKDERVDDLRCGCSSCRQQVQAKNEKNNFFSRYCVELVKITLSLILFVLGFFINGIEMILFIFSAVIVGYDLIINLIKNLIKLNFFDENTLMLIASITAFILGENFEGALIVILFFIGELLERIATDNSKRKISGLSKLKSKVAHLITREGMKDVAPEEIEVGSLIEIRSGESVPIDGILLGAPCDFDVKAITGESKYLTVENGGAVYSGAINVGNPVIIRTTKAYKDSTVENIISMVQGSLSKKAKAQKFITNFAKIYTPIIFCLAIFIGVIPPFIDQMNFEKWIYKALSFLVISCPCALVISVPLSFFIGIGGLAKKGVLVKGSCFLENILDIDTIVFDKTGTLTYGDFVIDNIQPFNGYSNEDVLDLAVCLEQKSNHPIARAIVKYKGKSDLICEDFEDTTGKGVSGVIENKKVFLGNEKLMKDCGISVFDEYAGTVLYLSIDNVLAGKIFVKDKIKENAKETLGLLRKMGLNNSIILSGDCELIAKSVGKEVGVEKVYYGLLPDDKLNKLKNIKSNKKVIYVGDGINDSPSLALADVGIAMGGLGSEIATGTSDVVILDDNLDKIPKTIKHARKIKRVVYQNIIGSLAIKGLIMLLSVLFPLPVWISMFADVGVMLLAVCNAFRVGKV